MKTQITKSQFKTYGPRPVSGYGPVAMITAKVRYDDQRGNGHNTFSITAEVVTPASKQRNDIEAGGCLHEEIVRVFPELAPYIKWHLVSSDGPMHYPGNALYHASDRDHRGLKKGERKQLVNGRTKQPVCQRVNEKGESVSISSSNWVDSDEKPVENLTVDWEPVWIEGEGKKRELDHARSCAVWPDATDDELLSPDLEQKLRDRLPGLMEDFQKAIESLGFTF